MMKKYFILILVLLMTCGCKNRFTPRPQGYFRISFPEKTYTEFNPDQFPYRFKIPVYSRIIKPDAKDSFLYDINISIPENKADIHISYKQIGSDKEKLRALLEDSRTLAYKHTIKAEAIEEQLFVNPEAKVYGTVYLIEGNVASPMQFFLTDSTTHFLRGSFYIRDIPNTDSLQPVIDFLKPDIYRLIETTSWK